MRFIATKPHHGFYACAIIPGSVENGDLHELADAGHTADNTTALFPVRWFRQGNRIDVTQFKHSVGTRIVPLCRRVAALNDKDRFSLAHQACSFTSSNCRASSSDSPFFRLSDFHMDNYFNAYRL